MLEAAHGGSLVSARLLAQDRPLWRLRSLVVPRLGCRQEVERIVHSKILARETPASCSVVARVVEVLGQVQVA